MDKGEYSQQGRGESDHEEFNQLVVLLFFLVV